MLHIESIYFQQCHVHSKKRVGKLFYVFENMYYTLKWEHYYSTLLPFSLAWPLAA